MQKTNTIQSVADVSVHSPTCPLWCSFSMIMGVWREGPYKSHMEKPYFTIRWLLGCLSACHLLWPLDWHCASTKPSPVHTINLRVDTRLTSEALCNKNGGYCARKFTVYYLVLEDNGIILLQQRLSRRWRDMWFMQVFDKDKYIKVSMCWPKLSMTYFFFNLGHEHYLWCKKLRWWDNKIVVDNKN